MRITMAVCCHCFPQILERFSFFLHNNSNNTNETLS